MIDFHSHILPGIDDGSHDIAESIELLKLEKLHQVDKVVLTPHFYADKYSMKHFLERRDHSLEKLMAALEEVDSPYSSSTISVGAEVYYFESMGRAEDLPKLCIQGTNLLLLEMPFCQWTQQMLDTVDTILNKQHLRVMLAHVERYIPYQKKKAVMETLLSMPVYVQLNAGSFLKWQKRHKCLNLMKQGYEVVLGSDCHNTHTRVPNLAQGREIIDRKLGHETLQRIDALGERLLQHE